MKYAWIGKNKAAWPVTVTCEVLGVSTSGYFEHQRWRRSAQPGPPRGAQISNEALLAHIRAVHAQVKGEYGWPGGGKKLLARGVRVGKARMQRLMHPHGIKARRKRKFVVTTDSKHDLPIAENLLGRDFAPTSSDRLLEQRHHLHCHRRRLAFRTVVLDLFSRQVVGWSMQPHMQTSLITDALRMAWFKRHPNQQAGLMALNTPSVSQQAASALAQQMDNVGTNLLNKNLSIQPTLTIRPGYAFNVVVDRTMILPPYPGQ